MEPVPVGGDQGVEHRLVGRGGARNLQPQIELTAALMIGHAVSRLFQLNQHDFFAPRALHHISGDLHQRPLRRWRPAAVLGGVVYLRVVEHRVAFMA